MGSMLRAIMETSDDRIPMLGRLALGIVMLPHGAQDLFGWFGGSGIDGALGLYTSLGVPPFLGWMAIVVQFFGGVALIVGVLGRVAAFAIALVLLAAVVTLHWSVGFFMNWNGALEGEGFEFHILAVTLAVIVIIRGSGALSVDRVLTARAAEAVASD
ncbi:MAG TPA: DoxX family protein [Gemmatimonadaceae bacterium]|jgi:putative oxidoreductase